MLISMCRAFGARLASLQETSMFYIRLGFGKIDFTVDLQHIRKICTGRSEHLSKLIHLLTIESLLLPGNKKQIFKAIDIGVT